MKERDIYYSAIEANIANKNRIYRKAVNSRQRPGLKRGLAVAASCFVVMASVVACVPEARAMVLNWLRPAVDSRQYIETPAAERTPETNAQKAVETAIESVRNKDIKVTVVNAADEQWQAWAEKLSVSFDEILYDGEDVYITGRLKGNARDLIKRSSEYTVTETGEYTSFAPPDDLVVPYVGYSVSGGDMQYLLMSPLVDEISSANVDKAYASDSMDISVRLPVGSGLKGNQQLTVFFSFTDMKTVRQTASNNPDHISDDEYLAKSASLVALRIDGLAFDATAGTTAQAAMPVPAPVMLKGDVLVFSGAESISGNRCKVGNDKLSIDGATFEITKMQQKLNGTALTFAVNLPESWTDKQCATAGKAMEPVFIIDGTEQGGFGKTYNSIRYLDTDSAHKISFTVETGLMPEDWSNINSVQAVLKIFELTEYNGVKLPEGGRAEASYDKGGWNEDSHKHILYDCPIIIK
ncbi:MAG: hypothetical protein PUC54_06005 [Clostridiales bacterium]|nr:hypothetical protein [Clostridiales bacterium]